MHKTCFPFTVSRCDLSSAFWQPMKYNSNLSNTMVNIWEKFGQPTKSNHLRKIHCLTFDQLFSIYSHVLIRIMIGIKQRRNERISSEVEDRNLQFTTHQRTHQHQISLDNITEYHCDNYNVFVLFVACCCCCYGDVWRTEDEWRFHSSRKHSQVDDQKMQRKGEKW